MGDKKAGWCHAAFWKLIGRVAGVVWMNQHRGKSFENLLNSQETVQTGELISEGRARVRDEQGFREAAPWLGSHGRHEAPRSGSTGANCTVTEQLILFGATGFEKAAQPAEAWLLRKGSWTSLPGNRKQEESCESDQSPEKTGEER